MGGKKAAIDWKMQSARRKLCLCMCLGGGFEGDLRGECVGGVRRYSIY